MPVVRDSTEIRNPVEILLRASRPQRSSTHLLHHRDWRYVTGVSRHEDEDNISYRERESTLWDQSGWDAQIGMFGKENRRYAAKKAAEPQDTILRYDEEEVEECRRPMGIGGAADFDMAGSVATLDKQLAHSEDVGGMLTVPKNVASSTRKRTLKRIAQARRSRQCFRSRAYSIAGFQRSGPLVGEVIEEDEEVWFRIRLVVCLKFSCQGTDKVQRILAGEPADGQAQVVTPNSPANDVLNEVRSTPKNDHTRPQVLSVDVSDTATTAPIAKATCGSDPDTDHFMRTLVPYERPCFDETRNANMKDILGTPETPHVEVFALSDLFNWFPEAVPADALFPPEVPISAKAIMAFYPHHIRWKGIALRLANNAYLGDTIIAMQAFFRGKDKHPLSITNVSQFFCDVLKNDLSDFEVSNFQCKPDRHLYTDHLRPSKPLNGPRHGFVVPSFNQLLEGLVYLPSGLDARGLTQCLAWYLDVRDTFTPRLDLNVLHTQSLIRALRMPLKPYKPRNLDKLALQEWQEKGQFAKMRLDGQGSSDADRVDHSLKQLMRSRVTIDTNTETLGVYAVVKLRHILTFPYFAIGGMMCKALELGIEKAEARKAAREVQEATEITDSTQDPAQEQGLTALSYQEKAGPKDNSEVSQEMRALGFPVGYKIPKKKRLLSEDDASEIQSKKRLGPALVETGASLGPRAMSISERRHAIAPHPLTTAVPPQEPTNRFTSFPPPDHGPTTAPASMLGYRRSQNPNHYHSAAYSSTFSDQHHPSPYASRFYDYAHPSHADSRTVSRRNTLYNTHHQYGDRRMSGSTPRGNYGPPVTSGWSLEHDSRNLFNNEREPQPLDGRYSATQAESTSRDSWNRHGYNGHRER